MLDKKIVALFVLFAISMVYDNRLALLVTATRTQYLDAFFSFLTNYFTTVSIFLLVLVILLRQKKALAYFTLSFAATGLLVSLLKAMIGRPRPYEALATAKLVGISYNFAAWNASFPSWHAASVFVALPFISKLFPRLKWYWFAFALLVSFSRVYVGVHYASDVIAGGLIGYVLGLLFLRMSLNKAREHQR